MQRIFKVFKLVNALLDMKVLKISYLTVEIQPD